MTILRYTAIQDAGTAVHPAYVEGQMQGGAVQGIGWALNEEYYYDDSGRMANSSFLDYRMPTSLDVPMIDTIIVEVPNPLHPFGVRGVGEPGIVPPLAAIANAVCARDRRAPDAAADVAAAHPGDDARDRMTMPSVQLAGAAAAARRRRVVGRRRRRDAARRHRRSRPPVPRPAATASSTPATIRPRRDDRDRRRRGADLNAPVPADAEVHILPAIAGG